MICIRNVLYDYLWNKHAYSEHSYPSEKKNLLVNQNVMFFNDRKYSLWLVVKWLIKQLS